MNVFQKVFVDYCIFNYLSKYFRQKIKQNKIKMENYNQTNFTPNKVVESHLVANIIATVIGFTTCWFLCISGFIGIPGIIFSAQAKNKFNLGDIAGAQKNAKTAKIFMIISFTITGLAILRLAYAIISGELQAAIEEAQYIIESNS